MPKKFFYKSCLKTSKNKKTFKNKKYLYLIFIARMGRGCKGFWELFIFSNSKQNFPKRKFQIKIFKFFFKIFCRIKILKYLVMNFLMKNFESPSKKFLASPLLSLVPFGFSMTYDVCRNISYKRATEKII